MNRLHWLYRDRENGLIFGVCAGIADYFEVDVLIVRAVTLIALLLFFVPTVAAYLTAAVLLKDRPLCYRGEKNETRFWSRG